METLAKNESYTPPLIFILIAVAIIVGVVVVYQDKLSYPPLVILLIFIIIVGIFVYFTIGRITRRILSTMILAVLIGGIFGTIAKESQEKEQLKYKAADAVRCLEQAKDAVTLATLRSKL